MSYNSSFLSAFLNFIFHLFDFSLRSILHFSLSFIFELDVGPIIGEWHPGYFFCLSKVQRLRLLHPGPQIGFSGQGHQIESRCTCLFHVQRGKKWSEGKSFILKMFNFAPFLLSAVRIINPSLVLSEARILILQLNQLMPNRYNCTYVLFFSRPHCCKKLTLDRGWSVKKIPYHTELVNP